MNPLTSWERANRACPKILLLILRKFDRTNTSILLKSWSMVFYWLHGRTKSYLIRSNLFNIRSENWRWFLNPFRTHVFYYSILSSILQQYWEAMKRRTFIRMKLSFLKFSSSNFLSYWKLPSPKQFAIFFQVSSASLYTDSINFTIVLLVS